MSNKNEEWEEIGGYKCFQCDKHFKSMKALKFHILGSKDHYGKGNAYKWLSERNYIKEKEIPLSEIYTIGGGK